MPSSDETAADTRQALLDAAGVLLDDGGPDAVTLRAVGVLARVSRGAPYGHFADKDDLLAALGTEGWVQLADELAGIRADPALSAPGQLRRALFTLVDIARDRPHRYALMFLAPPRSPDRRGHAVAAAWKEFLAIVAGVLDAADTRRTGALLLCAAHGIAAMELSGHLDDVAGGTGAEELTGMLAGWSAGADPGSEKIGVAT